MRNANRRHDYTVECRLPQTNNSVIQPFDFGVMLCDKEDKSHGFES